MPLTNIYIYMITNQYNIIYLQFILSVELLLHSKYLFLQNISGFHIIITDRQKWIVVNKGFKRESSWVKLDTRGWTENKLVCKGLPCVFNKSHKFN